MDADHARLGAEDEVVGRLELPQRAQAERVGREDALVAVAGDQRHRALRERAHRLAQVHVEGVQLVRQRADLVDDRRHDHLHRLGEREALAADQRVDGAVQVLGVGAVGVDRHAEHPRLLAQLRDRVDLAVVAEDRERLHALERGPGVGRVAVVAEAADRLEALVAQVRVVRAEHLRRAHHLVDAGRRRERGDVEAELAPRARSSGRRRARSARRRRRGRRSARSAAPPRARSAPSAGESTAPRRSARMRKPPRPRISRPSCWACSRSCERSMKTWATAKASSSDERRVVAAGADLLGPDLARDVDQDPAAVALAVDVAGAVEHLLEVLERERHRLAARGRVLAHGGVDRAGVAVLDARRRDARAPRQLGRVALAGGQGPGTGGGTGWHVYLRFRAFFERARDGDNRARDYTVNLDDKATAIARPRPRPRPCCRRPRDAGRPDRRSRRHRRRGTQAARRAQLLICRTGSRSSTATGSPGWRRSRRSSPPSRRRPWPS